MSLNQTFMNITASTCTVEGNSDLYGLGNRIAIYLQMLTVQLSSLTSRLATVPVDDKIGQATVIFILATMTVFLRMVNDNTVEAVEAVPILGLVFAQAAVCKVSFFGSKLTLIIFIAELIGVLAFFVWFWWKGMDDLPRTCEKGYAFFFAKVSIWGWFRKLNKAISIISVVVTGSTYLINFCIFMFIVITSIVDKEVENRFTNNSTSKSTVEMTLNIGMILFVELSLRWNKITDVHSLSSPGQFMPFFIALAQLLSTIYRLVNVVALENEEEEDEEEEEAECIHKRKSPPVDLEGVNQDENAENAEKT